MTWEQKIQALQAISEVSLHMRHPGNWSVGLYGVSIGGDGFLTSIGPVSGKTPEDAVEQFWTAATILKKPHLYLSKGARKFRWNSFMWADVE